MAQSPLTGSSDIHDLVAINRHTIESITLRNTASFFDPAAEHQQLQDGRKYVIYLPNGRDPVMRMLSADANALKAESVYFVGFFGTRRKNPTFSEDTAREIWRGDRRLRGRMVAYPSVLYYSSIQKTMNGDWCNLIVSTEARFREEWTFEKDHEALVRNYASKYYSSVRIQSGVVWNGLGEPRFEIRRTVLVDYDRDQRKAGPPLVSGSSP